MLFEVIRDEVTRETLNRSRAIRIHIIACLSVSGYFTLVVKEVVSLLSLRVKLESLLVHHLISLLMSHPIN